MAGKSSFAKTKARIAKREGVSKERAGAKTAGIVARNLGHRKLAKKRAK